MPHIEALNDNIPLTSLGNPQGHVITSRNPNASQTPLRAIRINNTTTMTFTPTSTGPVLVTSGRGSISETLRRTEEAISWLDRVIQGTELGGNILSIYSLPIPLNIGPLVYCLKQMLEVVRSGLENQVDALNLVIDCYNHVNSLRTQLMCRVDSPSLVVQNVVEGLTERLQKNVDLLAALSTQSSLKRMWRSTQSRRTLIAAREDTCRYLDNINLQLNIMQSQQLDQQHDLIYVLNKRVAQLERAFRGSKLVPGSARMIYVDQYTLVIQEEETEFCKLLGCLTGPNFPDTRLIDKDLKVQIIDSFSQMPWKGNRLEILGFVINLTILYQLLTAKLVPYFERNIAQGMPIYLAQQYCQTCMRLVEDLVLVPRSWSSRLMNREQVQRDLKGMTSQLAQKVAPLSLDIAILVTRMHSDASYHTAIGQGLYVETLQRYRDDPLSIKEVVKTLDELADLQIALRRRIDDYIQNNLGSTPSIMMAQSGAAWLQFSFEASIFNCFAKKSIHCLPDWVIPECELHRVETLKHLSSSRCIWKNRSVFVKEFYEVVDPSPFARAIEVMRLTRHQYVQPFLGAPAFAGPKPWYIVTAWNKRRSLEYELSRGPGCIDRLSIAYHISQGMEYLHSRGIIHGNLHSGNVLLDETGQPIISDYAYTPLKREKSKHSGCEEMISSQRHYKGLPLQTCLSESLTTEEPPAKSGDVYAFAIIVYHLYVPGSHGETRMLKTIRQSISGTVHSLTCAVLLLPKINERLDKTLADESYPKQPIGMTDDMYRLLQRCWARIPDERPSFQAICEVLEEMSEAEYSRGTLRPLLWHAGHLPTQHERCGCRQPDFETSRKYLAFFDFNKHDYGFRSPLLNFPLWEPRELSIGDIGYNLDGHFIRLGSIFEYTSKFPAYLNLTTGKKQKEISVNRSHRRPKVSHMSGLLTAAFQEPETFKRTQKSKGHLPCDHQMTSAQLVSSNGKFRRSTAIPKLKEMFVAQIENILGHAPPEHGKLEKPDILLIVGALRSRDFAISVATYTANEPIDRVIYNRKEPSPSSTAQKSESSRGKGLEMSSVNSTAVTTSTSTTTSSPAILEIVDEPKDTGLQCLENVHRFRSPYSAVRVSDYDGPELDVCLSVLRFAPGSDEPTIYRD